MKELTSHVLSELVNADIAKALNKVIFKNAAKKTGNQFLFILKPEVFYYNNQEQIQQVLELIFDRFNAFGLQVDNMRLFNSAYLEKYNIIAEHYGVINAVARNVKSNITKEATESFSNIYHKNFSAEKVYGAIEILETTFGVDNEKLAALWKNCTIERLAGGIYCGEVEFENETIYIINGFHPPQIDHFIENGRQIITMNLSGEIDWKDARQNLIGNTYPEKAEKGTIRRDLFEQFGKFGFKDVSYVINSVHLSAGPLEGLIELMRFNSENSKVSSHNDFLFGQSLTKNFKKNICDEILTNPIVKYHGKEASLFDLTEELNSLNAIGLLKQIDW